LFYFLWTQIMYYAGNLYLNPWKKYKKHVFRLIKIELHYTIKYYFNTCAKDATNFVLRKLYLTAGECLGFCVNFYLVNIESIFQMYHVSQKVSFEPKEETEKVHLALTINF